MNNLWYQIMGTRATICLYSPQYHFCESCGGSLQMDNILPCHTIVASQPCHSLSTPSIIYPWCYHRIIRILHLPCLVPVHLEMKSMLQSTSSIQSWKMCLLLNISIFSLPRNQWSNYFWMEIKEPTYRQLGRNCGCSIIKWDMCIWSASKNLFMMRSLWTFLLCFAKTKTCSMPSLCRSSCALSKMTKQKTNTQHHTNDPAKEMALQRVHLSPGACISWDQYIVPHCGWLYTSAGRERESLRFGGGTLAVDHASKRDFYTIKCL